MITYDEIKIRAWDNQHGKDSEAMIYSDKDEFGDPFVDVRTVSLTLFLEWVGQHQNEKNPMPLMFWTGYVSKDGIDIYDEDILKFSDGPTVTVNSKNFHWGSDSEDATIIGNTYEGLK